MDTKVTQLAEMLHDVVGCDDARDFGPVREFWAREPQRAIEPECIQAPDEFAGGPYLSIACTQTDLPDKQQKRLVDTWCEVLPTLRDVQWVWFYSKVPQRLLEAACQLPQLTGLYIKWSGIEDLEPLSQCAKLSYLKLGSSASVQSIHPLGRLGNLKWLQLENVKAASNLEPLSTLTSLEGFGFLGAESRSRTIDSFDPLGSMTSLIWLHLGGIRTRDNSLKALANLRNLQYLGLAKWFPYEEFARLSLYLSPAVCQLLQPYVRFHSSVFPCKKCKKNWKVMAPGKGGRLLCPTCDSLALARHVLKFNAAREAATRDGNAR